jgi:UV DNA damage endonuclease
MTTPRIGFACKFSELTPKGIESVPELNVQGTTVAWLKRQSTAVAEEKLWDLMKRNIESVKKLVTRVGSLDEHLRMVRLGSDILPVYTQADYSYFWRQPDVIAYAERHFATVGEIARDRNVRLSMHPGQFVVLASESEGIVDRSIEEFEYHADMARWMGYGREFQDFKINVHISGRKGAQGIRDVYGRLSPEARNCLTIENEENSWGLDDCLSLSDLLPIVLDVHHHWVREGEYLSTTDQRVARVLDSWRGVRPTLHYSVSREDYLVGHSKDVEPDYPTLLAAGYKKQKLRAHSDYYWNNEVNAWAAGFSTDFDIMCESKAKNLASFEFAKLVRQFQTLN